MNRVWIVENAVPVQTLSYNPPVIDKVGVLYLLQDSTASWDEEEVRLLCEAFCSDEYELTVLTSPAQLEKYLDSGVEPPHVVIFDWEGPGFGEATNLAAIKKLLSSTFTYVQVYTQLGAEAVEPYLVSLRKGYGDRLLPARAKTEVTPSDLGSAVKAAWRGTIAGETADQVRMRARGAVERVLIDLCSVRRNALAAMTGGDEGQLVAVIMAKLRDELGPLHEELTTIVKGGGVAEAAEDLRRFQSALYYYFPSDNVVRSGDLVVDRVGHYGVVITPWCHLGSFQRKTAGRLTIVGAYELNGATLEAAGVEVERVGPSATAAHGKAAHSVIVLPNVPKAANDRSALVDWVVVTHEWNTTLVSNVEGALSYSSVELTRICTLTETFSGGVLSHLARTISAVGIPDFPKFESDRLAFILGKT
jgi:hypothetical protein